MSSSNERVPLGYRYYHYWTFRLTDLHCYTLQTLQILNKIDANIIESYYTQSLETIPLTLSIKAKDEYATRLLEVVQVQSGEDGESYARQAKTLIGLVENSSSSQTLRGKHPISVLEGAVEMILMYLRTCESRPYACFMFIQHA